MEARIKKFLEFNGKVLSFITIDGIVWIAIKPICQALGIQYERQFKNLNSDKILVNYCLNRQWLVPIIGLE